MILIVGLGVLMIIVALVLARKAKAARQQRAAGILKLSAKPRFLGDIVDPDPETTKFVVTRVLWTEGTNGRWRKRTGQLLRTKGRRGIIRPDDAPGTKVRRKLRLLHPIAS
jgi:ribosomal protein L35AE/L33A